LPYASESLVCSSKFDHVFHTQHKFNYELSPT